MLRKQFRFTAFFLVLGMMLATSCASKKKVAREPFNSVIKTARSYSGTPYKYGGTTRSGMDCSALVYHSFHSVGITMPRMSTDQSKMGKSIRTKEIKPGDVLFFATGKRRKQVTHSGIVTETSRDDVRFIHSSTSLGVSEDFLSNNYWSKAFLFARRVLD
ncbi:C40 family peptidase [Algoriphagus sp. C2-6-M1]|uniref:C40 family peptidase n=1 Tax=Algoriphagus persicinus TaxID=3108754 RepID=UPI002B3F3D78|nr:C40 family peptidase [Algoriphagus sp. C2-6-M1]MEB2779436.1 C40 family peptidase [Algoriphagus sp. C2-6-M1]